MEPQLTIRMESLKKSNDLEYFLLGDLHQLLDEPRSQQTRQSLLVILDQLIKHLPRQLQLQSESGYMSRVLEEFPHWNKRIELLRGEDIGCCWLLEQLRERIADESPILCIAKDTCRSVGRWMKSFRDHRRRETDLLQAAFTRDIGGEA